MTASVKYTSLYSQSTFLRYGELASHDDVEARQLALRQYKVRYVPGYEVWVKGYGICPLFEGPDLDLDTMNMLCIQPLGHRKPIPCS